MALDIDTTFGMHRAAAREVDTLLGPFSQASLPDRLDKLEARSALPPGYDAGTDLCLEGRAIFLECYLQWLKPGQDMRGILKRLETLCGEAKTYLQNCKTVTTDPVELADLETYQEHNTDRIALIKMMLSDDPRSKIIDAIECKLDGAT